MASDASQPGMVDPSTGAAERRALDASETDRGRAQPTAHGRTSEREDGTRLAEVLPSYEIGEEIGRGACGVVLAGHHRQLDREVAIKQLWSRFGPESDMSTRFRAEARVLGSFDHPHVVQIFDYVEAPGLCVLIMERLTGGTVRDRMAGGRLAPQTACAVLVAACAGLEYAHARGVLHRDVKPQNLLLSAEGVLKVADFGIAKIVAGSSATATRTGVMLGTPNYMAPEQIQGAEATRAVDVYAAGTVLYEMLCGELPFPTLRDPLAAMYQRVQDEPIPLLRRASDLPLTLAAITDRALRVDPSQRYASAAELASAVVRAAEQEWGPHWIQHARWESALCAPLDAEAAVIADSGAAVTRSTSIGAPRSVAKASAAPEEPLERERELQTIAAALRSAAAGAGRAVVIEGPAGIGKTRLVQDTRALAKSLGFGRLQAVGDELESAIPWAVVRQMVERSISRYQGEVREAILAGPTGDAVAALSSAPPDAPAGDAAVARTLHALWWVAVDLSSFRPLLITVDDAQWADLPSLRFLDYLSRRIADLPIAVVVATRPPGDRAGPLAQLSAGGSVERILPPPLSQRAVAALCALRGNPADDVVAAVYAASAGNPFFARAVLDELEARGLGLEDPGTAALVKRLGPRTISRAVLARLPPDATALAGAAAVLGTRSDSWLAAGMIDLEGDRLAAATDALVAGHVLAPGEEQLVFLHPVVREAVVSALGPGERAALHAKAARALHATGAPVTRVAAHLVAAPTATLDEGAALLREAAAVLLADGDPVTAAAHLARALEEAPRDQRLQAELGLALLRAREYASAREHLRAAAQAAPSRQERAERLAAAASATVSLEGANAAISELRDVLEQWPGPVVDEARLVLEARLASICSLVPDQSRQNARRLQRFADLPGRTPAERTLLALVAQRQRYDMRPAREVVGIVDRALGEGAYLDDVAHSTDGWVGWVVAVTALLAADAVAPATAEVGRARVRVRERGSPLEFGMVSSAATVLAWWTGDVVGTETEAEAALAAVAAEDAGAHVVVAVRATSTHFGIHAALERDNRAAALTALRTFDALCTRGPRVIPVVWLREARAVLALACDEPARAHEEAMAMRDEVRAANLDIPTVSWRFPAVVALQRLGRSDEARAIAAEQLELARRWGAASDIGAALRLVACVEPERRVDLLTIAVAALENAPARLILARTLVDLGEALRDAGNGKEARELLRRGADLAAACGSRVLRRRAVDALAALGDEARQTRFSRPQPSLSASERRVVELAVEGRSDRDIAMELFVTPKAIHGHISQACVKLGITSRTELAAALRLGLQRS